MIYYIYGYIGTKEYLLGVTYNAASKEIMKEIEYLKECGYEPVTIVRG